jgi:O-antigen ligase
VPVHRLPPRRHGAVEARQGRLLNPPPAFTAAQRVLAVAAPAAAWAAYMPIGAKYLGILVVALAALVLLVAQQRLAGIARQPGAAATAALVGLLGLSSLWSPASWREIAFHLWLYGLLLLVPVIACACPAVTARLALRHFAAASGVVGLLFVLHWAGALPPSRLWSHTVDAHGNQRVCNSLLLALGVATSLWHATQTPTCRWPRVAWLALAAVTALGLSLQDRRTGMLVLPLLLLAWALARPAPARRRAAMALAIALAAAATWNLSDGVRARMAEGIAELRSYESSDAIETSWGQRVRMVEVTAAMVRDRPWLGHGVASWRTLWRERTRSGTLLAANSTPHNEYLLLAQQAGLPGAALLLALLVACVRAALRCGPAGLPMLMVWLAIAGAGLFNAVLRDAKFSLPLLLLAGLTAALSRGEVTAGEAARPIHDN